MMIRKFFHTALMAAFVHLSLGSLAIAGAVDQEHHDDKPYPNEYDDAQENHDDEDEGIHMSDEMAELNGVVFATAAGGVINGEVVAYARLNTAPTQRADLQARFAGVVTRVNVAQGQVVKQGDVLASIEANHTLQSFDLRAPFDGTVQAVHMSVGEFADQQVLLTLVDTRTLVAEIELFHSQRGAVETGMPVDLFDGDHHYPSTITTLLPTDIDTPHVTALAPFENHDQHHSPGDLVKATIGVSQNPAAVRVENSAIQVHDGGPVVFVREGDRYEARPVVLGERDTQYTEVVDGLNAGETYVSVNSYLFKAEAEKSGAEHGH